MKPVKCVLVNSFDFGPQEKRMKKGTELLVFGKWEDSGSNSGISYLVYNPEKDFFKRLDSGHLKVEEDVKMKLPKFAYNNVQYAKRSEGHDSIYITPTLIIPEGTELTMALYNGIEHLVIAVHSDFKYPSGAGYLIIQIENIYKEEPVFVDSLDVEITKQGNMVVF